MAGARCRGKRAPSRACDEGGFPPESATAAKIEHLIGLDRAIAILSWGPIDKLDSLCRSYQAQVLRIMLSIAVKAAVQGKLDRELARERGRQEAIERFRQAMERAVAARRAREKA